MNAAKDKSSRNGSKKAADLVTKYPDAESLFATHYGENDCVLYKDILILFDPESRRNVVGSEKFSYNEYLDVQLASLGKKHRSYFAACFVNGVKPYVKGQIDHVDSKHICFKRIFISQEPHPMHG